MLLGINSSVYTEVGWQRIVAPGRPLASGGYQAVNVGWDYIADFGITLIVLIILLELETQGDKEVVSTGFMNTADSGRMPSWSNVLFCRATCRGTLLAPGSAADQLKFPQRFASAQPRPLA